MSEPWCDARDAIRSALGLGRATAIARAIENQPPAHILAADVAAAKEPFDVALVALDALADIAEAADRFGQHVLDCDTYGCENGPSRCLHGEASRFLDVVRREPNSQAIPD